MKWGQFCELLFILQWTSQQSVLVHGIKIVCFFSNEIPGYKHFNSDNINPNLCTHLVYSHASLNTTANKLTLKNQKMEDDLNRTEKFAKLKQKNPELKILINIRLAEDSPGKVEIKASVEKTLNFLKQYKFDGLNIDTTPRNKSSLTAYLDFIEALRNTFQTGEYLLTSYGDGFQKNIDLFDTKEMSRLNHYLDFLIVKAYRLISPSTQPLLADHHSPLWPRPCDKILNHTVDSVINRWIHKGFPANKLVLGISLYGHSWNISTSKTRPPVQANGQGEPGTLSKRKGTLVYSEICLAVQTAGLQVFQDPDRRMGPYAVSSNASKNFNENSNRTWVGYDDPDMVVIKSKYVLCKGLAGVSVFDVSMDDFQNKCGQGNNSIMTSIWNTLKAKPELQTTNLTHEEQTSKNPIKADVDKGNCVEYFTSTTETKINSTACLIDFSYEDVGEMFANVTTLLASVFLCFLVFVVILFLTFLNYVFNRIDLSKFV